MSVEACVHLVYPHRKIFSAPDSIGWFLSDYLKQMGCVVKVYDWDSKEQIKPKPGDVLIGHPHPEPDTVFRKSIRSAGWKAKIILQPFNFDAKQVGFLEAVVPQCDLFIAICGDFWFDNLIDSRFKHWRQKMVQLNLAIAWEQFPLLKASFAAPAQRRFLYIGNDSFPKNIPYLEQLAAAFGSERFGWIGSSRKNTQIRQYGYLNLQSEAGREIIAKYDFLITVGTADANPTTILEAMAWGLIPVCSPQSGYYKTKGIFNIPLKDVAEAVATLRRIDNLSEAKLLQIQAANRALVCNNYTWNKFGSQVYNFTFTKIPHVRSKNFGRADVVRNACSYFFSPNSSMLSLRSRVVNFIDTLVQNI